MPGSSRLFEFERAASHIGQCTAFLQTLFKNLLTVRVNYESIERDISHYSFVIHIFKGLAKKRKERTVNDESACAAILEVVFAKNILPPNVAFVGKTRIFVKSNEHRSMLEQCRQDRILVYAIRIQAGIR